MGFKDKTWINNSAPELEDDDLNGFKNEFNNTYTTTGQTPNNSDLLQTSKAMSIYTAGSDYYTDSGAANSYVLSPSNAFEAPIAYFPGMRVRFRPNNNNTGASTINVNSLGAVNIKMTTDEDPEANQINTQEVIELVYDGTSFVFANAPKPGLVIDRLSIPLHTTDFTGVETELAFFENTRNIEASRFNKAMCKPGRVWLSLWIEGGAITTTEFIIRFRQGAGTGGPIIFEYDYGVFGNQLDEFTALNVDLSSGNIVNLDLSVTDLLGVNSNLGPWSLTAIQSVDPAGTYQISNVQFLYGYFS